MILTVRIPDDFAARLAAQGGDLGRRTLEALALEEYRTGHLTRPELRRMLGFDTRAEVDAFLKERGLDGSTTVEASDLQQQALDRQGT